MLSDTLNRPLHDLRISVTDKCNFRCHYCMPEEIFGHKYEFLAREKILTFEEIARLARLFATFGVKKIRLTGGEPLLRQELHKLISMLAAIPEIQDLALTTNGYFLAEKAEALKHAGLKRVTVSLDTLDPRLFKKMAGKHLDIDRVFAGLDAAARLGFTPIKLNSVIQRNVNQEEILPLLRFAREKGFIVRFIEYMDVGNLNDWKMEEVISAQEIVKTISAKYRVEAVEKDNRSEVANRFRFLDGSGEFGVIASVTQPFCQTCTRARLSADGKVYTCLFATDGLDLKTPMRQGASDEELLDLLRTLWQARTDRYSEVRFSQGKNPPDRKVEMYQIGG